MFNEFGNRNLTKDGVGYVYWKGIQIEHFSFRDQNAEDKAAKELAGRCINLEIIGVPVTGGTTVWFKDWFEYMPKDHKYKGVLASCPHFYEHAETHRIGWISSRRPKNKNNSVLFIWDGKKVSFEEIEGDELGGTYHPLRRLGWAIPDIGQGKDLGLCYSNLEQITAFLDKYNFPHA